VEQHLFVTRVNDYPQPRNQFQE